MTDDEPENWLDNQNVVIAGGLAALLLLGLLIWGVVRVANDSSQPPPDVVLPGTSPATSPIHSSGLVTPPSTSYTLPSVQTNQPGVPPPGPAEAPSDSGGGPATVDTPTTIYNPYATPSSSSSAGHI